MTLTSEQAFAIADAVLAAGRALDLRPLAVTVLDTGGHPIVTKREDAAGILRHEIAHAKAWGCLGLGRGGGMIARHAQDRSPVFVSALTSISGGRIAPSCGGVLIRELGGLVLGAVGVSGDSSDNDEKAACAGIVSVGLLADAG